MPWSEDERVGCALVPYERQDDEEDDSRSSGTVSRKKSSKKYHKKKHTSSTNKKRKKDKDKKYHDTDRHRYKKKRSRDSSERNDLDENEYDTLHRAKSSLTTDPAIHFPEHLRSFESVTKSLGTAKGQQKSVLAIEPEVASVEGIDYIRYAILGDIGIDEPVEELYKLKARDELNKIIKHNPKDVPSWIKLAKLSYFDYKQCKNRRKDISDDEMKIHLDRTTEILQSALKENSLNFEIYDALLSCDSFDSTTEMEHERFRSVIDKFLENTNDDINNQFPYGKAFIVVSIYRKYIRRLMISPGKFSHDNILEVFIQGFSTIEQLYGSGRGIQRTGPEPALLFLDLLRFLSTMGYSERSCGLIQAALDINSTAHGRDSCNIMFKTFWESESNRIGETHPAGYDQWNIKRREKLSNKRRFCGNKEIDQSNNISNEAHDFLSRAYKSNHVLQNASPGQEDKISLKNNEESLMLDLLKRKGYFVGNRKVDKSEEIPASHTANIDVLERLISQSNGTLLPSKVTTSVPGLMRVYSVIHGKSIEVSESEVYEMTKNTVFHQLLGRLKNKTNGLSSSQRIISKDEMHSKFCLHEVSENDCFVKWAKAELAQHPVKGLFQTPLKTNQLDNDSEFDPSRIVLYEDGISEIVQRYLTDFDSNGMSALVLSCLTWLGVSFPRSHLFDENNIRGNVSSIFGCGGEDVTETLEFNEVLNGIFYKGHTDVKKFDSQKSVYRQIILDNSYVRFNPSIFEPRGKMQANFLRNLLHSLVQRSESSQSYSVKCWSPYIQMALILFEGELSADLKSAQAVAQQILAGTDAAKHDPRLWIAYVMIELKKTPDTSTKNALKILTKALSTVKDITGRQRRGWVELCIIAVKLLCGLPILPSSDFTIRPDLSAKSKQKALHIICCAVEGEYFPFSEKGKHDHSCMDLVSKERYESAYSRARKNLIGIHDNKYDSNDYFDSTPTWVFDVALQVWLEVLNPNESGLHFQFGLRCLDDWFMREQCSHNLHMSQGIMCVLQLYLELAVVQSLLHGNESMSACLKPILTTAISILNGKTPTPAFLLSLAVFENESLPSKYSFSDIILSNFDCSGTESFFHVITCVMKYLTTIDLQANYESNEFEAMCSNWSTGKINEVRRALLRAVSCEYGSSMPCFWRALIRLELIGGSNVEGGGISKSPTRAFLAARTIFERGISYCVASKVLWLDAFTILRPAFSPEELSRQLFVLEEKGIRLIQGHEEISYNDSR